MGFFQQYGFEWVILGVCSVSVLFSALVVSVKAAESQRRRHRQEAEETTAHEKHGGFGAIAGKKIELSKRVDQSAQHDTIPASSVPPGGGMHEGVPGPDHPAIQVNADELLDPPVTAGCAADLNSGRSLLMVVGMQKIMPRPTGGLLSRMVWVNEVYQVKMAGSSLPLFLLYPSADYHSLALSITAPGPLKLFPITGVKGITVRLQNEPPLNLSVKVDTINSEQLDISAVWDTISLVESIKGKREAVDVGVALTFTGIQATHPFEFHIKVKLASAEDLVTAESQLYQVPNGFLSKAPSWAKASLTGQPVVLKFNVKQEV